MPMDACALVSWMLTAIAAVLSWYTMMSGDWECMVVALAFSAADVLLVGFVLAVKYCH